MVYTIYLTRATKKPTVTQNLRYKLPEIVPGTTVQMRTDKQNIWDKKDITAGQNNHPQPYDILNKEENILAWSCRHVTPTTDRFNIKYDYGIIIPITKIIWTLWVTSKWVSK